MMKDIYRSIFLLFSHKLTDSQIEELKSNGITSFVYLPHSLQILWSNVPPDLKELKGYLKPIIEWLKANAKEGDWVLVQGDFGAVFIVVDFCFQNGLVPVYATTERIAIEKVENGRTIKVSQFSHVIFRKYERWQE